MYSLASFYLSLLIIFLLFIRRSYQLWLSVVRVELSWLKINLIWLVLYILIHDLLLRLTVRNGSDFVARYCLFAFWVFPMLCGHNLLKRRILFSEKD